MSLQSNRANAQLSTGPRTAEGKAAASLNATTHGLSVNRISRRNPHALAVWEQRRAAYAAQLGQPALNSLQADLIDTLATARTRMQLIEEAQDSLPDETSPEYQLLQRYWRDAERSLSRALRLFQSLATKPAAAAPARVAQGKLELDRLRLEFRALQAELATTDPAHAARLASFRQQLESVYKETALRVT